MSYHEGSNWQAKKEDEKKPLYEPIQPTPEGEKVEERLFTLEEALKIFDAGVSRGESYIDGWGYENDNGSAEHYFKDKFGIDI